MSSDGSESACDQPAADSASVEPLAAAAPWLARKDWARGTLYYSTGIDLGMWVPAVLGSVFLGAFIAFLSATPGQIRAHGLVAIVPLLVLGPLGVGLTVRTAGLIDRWIRYGGSRLRLETVPIPTGGGFRAELTLSRPIKAGEEVKFQLQCHIATVHQMRSLGSNSDDPFPEDVDYQVKWQDEQTLTSDGSGTLHVAFAIPPDVPGTSAPNRQFWYFWQLKAEAGGGSGAYHAEFDVPVFKVAPSDKQAEDAKSITAARQAEQDAYQPTSELQVAITPLPGGGTEFVFPPLRSAAHALTQTVIFFIAFGLFVLAFAQLSVLAAVIWGTVNLLLFAWLLRIWFATEVVVIGDGQVSLTSGLFRVQQKMPLAQVRSIHVIAGPMCRRHAIRIRGASWRHFDVGDGIADQRDAEWLAAQMSRAAGIEPSPPVRGYQPAEDFELMMDFVKDVEKGKVNFGPLGNALMDAFMRKRNSE